MKVHSIQLILGLLLFTFSNYGQSEAYQEKKAKKIAVGSVFTKIINREAPATIVYEDADIIAFVPLRLQAPVHLLIVPKKEGASLRHPNLTFAHLSAYRS